MTHPQLVTGASSVTIGAALHQVVNGTPVPNDFFSKKFTEPQVRYFASDRELLVAHLSVLHFKPFLEGREINF